MHNNNRALVALLALVSAAGVGCRSSSSSQPVNPNASTGTTRASLHRAKTCGDLLSDLKGDASYKLNRAIDRQIETVVACLRKYSDDRCAQYGGYYGYGSGGVGFAESGTAAKGVASPMAAGTSTSSSSSGSGAPAPAPSAGGEAAQDSSKSSSAGSYSSTNTQVKGVDEADIVKNDGQNLYVLHGRAFKIVKAWPATDLKELSTLDIEGDPTEMFVADGRVVVYSQVNGAAVFNAAGVAPKQPYTEYGGGSYAYGGNAKMTGMAPPTAPSMPGGVPGGTPVPYAPLTKITVLALNDNAPSVTREIYFEGSYLDARRVGQHVRSVFQSYQYGPKLKGSIYELYEPHVANGTTVAMPPDGSKPLPPDQPQPQPQPQVDPYPKTGTQTIIALEKLRSANLVAIDATQLNDWLPYTFVKTGPNVSVQSIACEDFYIPTAGSTQGGMTAIASLDLADPNASPKQSAILGQADTVYGSADTLYLAARAWIEPPFIWNDPYEMNGGSSGGTVGSPPTGSSEPGGVPMPTPGPLPKPGGAQAQSLGLLNSPVAPTTTVFAWSAGNTHIHKFEFSTDPKFPNYVASGTVVGNTKDQFSLDDKDGYLRIATSENRQYATVEGRYVSADFTTTTNGGPAPVRPSNVNHVFTLGLNGPWLDVTGDVGDLAPNEQIYSVRFIENRGYVVTFRQTDPLFVIDLASPKSPKVLASLTIPGFSEYMHPLDANHLLTIGRSSTRGLQLQIFDVTNGANPLVVQKFTYTGAEYGSSDAEYDHKAFTYFAEKNLLAFPYYANNYVNGGMRSSLELFHVDIGTGFIKLGSIDSTPFAQQNPNGYCGGYFAPSVRRGVFLENFVYSVSYGGIVAKNAADLVAPGAQLALPNPQLNAGYGPVCYEGK